MTTAQYLAALKRLGLTPHGIKTREALGKSARQLARYAKGYPIESTVEKLLTALMEKRK